MRVLLVRKRKTLNVKLILVYLDNETLIPLSQQEQYSSASSQLEALHSRKQFQLQHRKIDACIKNLTVQKIQSVRIFPDGLDTPTKRFLQLKPRPIPSMFNTTVSC